MQDQVIRLVAAQEQHHELIQRVRGLISTLYAHRKWQVSQPCSRDAYTQRLSTHRQLFGAPQTAEQHLPRRDSWFRKATLRAGVLPGYLARLFVHLIPLHALHFAAQLGT